MLLRLLHLHVIGIYVVVGDGVISIRRFSAPTSASIASAITSSTVKA